MSNIISDIHRTVIGEFLFVPTFCRDNAPLSTAALSVKDFMDVFKNKLTFTQETVSVLSKAMTSIRSAINVRTSYLTSLFEQELAITNGTLDVRYFIIPFLLKDYITGESRIVALYVPPSSSQVMVMLSWNDIKYCKDDVMIIEGTLDFSELREFDSRWTMHLLDPAHHEIVIEDANFKIILTNNEVLEPEALPLEEMHILTVPANSTPDMLRVTSSDRMQTLNIDLKNNSLMQRKLNNIEFSLNVSRGAAESLYGNPGVHEYLQDGFTDKTIH